MFDANATGIKVTTDTDKDSNRLTAKVTFDCITNPDMVLELNQLMIKGVAVKVHIYTEQVGLGRKPDVPGTQKSPDDPLWTAQDKPGAAQTLLAEGDKTPADKAKELLSGNPQDTEGKGKRGRKKGKSQPPAGTEENGIDYPPAV